MNIIYQYTRQKGAISLLTALILLIGISLITFFTAKTVLVETQISANNYRTSQAVAAAQAALDQGTALFMAGGTDHVINEGNPALLNLGTNNALFYFDNVAGNRCGVDVGDNNAALLIARGWSDDATAMREISQCLGTFDIFAGGKSPEQPFVTRVGVGALGNAQIINRYNNSNIWAGGDAGVAGASFATYLRPSNKSRDDLTPEQLISEDTVVDGPGIPPEDVDAQLVSNKNAGYGIDVVTNDPTLGTKTSDEFFEMFFAQTKTHLMDAADNVDQRYDSGTQPPNNTTGLIWVGSDGAPSTTKTTINNASIGSPSNIAIIIVNGDLSIAGNVDIYGVVYVTGELKVAGTATIRGSVISENGPNDIQGTMNVVYVPYGEGSGTPNPFIPGTGAVIPGSWRDW
ncbi:MAG: hypothetical protein CVV06_10390 [Gammaproteobacteria bacterium HGW-Gammaproteobacteria-10]|nr:MAG: hypothetical protein CVV06_10390 [Gammaproteobacteria bacterium HGW-Gammaproteobacteria-10]